MVACGGEVAGALGWREEVNEAADGGPEASDGSLRRLAQERLQLGEGVLDRVEVRCVGRTIEQARPGRFDQLPHPWPLVAGQVVHDQDRKSTRLNSSHANIS